MPPKNHHFVPRFYLKTFTDQSTPAGQEPYLWVYERGESDGYRSAPRNVAAKTHYYSYVSQSGEVDTAVEELLSVIEGAAAPVLRDLIAGRDPKDLSEQDRDAFAYFIGMMAVRVPRYRRSVEKSIADLMHKVGLVAAHHPAYFERTVREACAAKGVDPPDDIEALRQFVLGGQYTIEPDPLFSLQTMLDLAPLGADYAFNYQWRILTAPNGSSFITSDAPLVKVSTERLPPPWSWGTGWETPWMEATIPLSPRKCLLISLHHPSGIEDVTDTIVRDVNWRTAAYASEAVFSSGKITPESLNRDTDWTWWTPASNVVHIRTESADATDQP